MQVKPFSQIYRNLEPVLLILTLRVVFQKQKSPIIE